MAVVLLEEVDTEKVAAGAVFCGVGAIAGFFNRLYADQRTERTIEDYGLSTARLLRTALFSALAGVGGVVMVAMLPATLNDLALGDEAATSTAVPSPTTATELTVVEEPPETFETQPQETIAPGQTPAPEDDEDAVATTANADPEYPSLDSIFDLKKTPSASYWQQFSA